jgi:hypothetical protein
MAATKVSLKLFIDKKRQRVLYAEADKDFVDFLFSIFTLPLGVVTRLLKEGGGMVGSSQSLYQSIENLSVTHINRDKSKFFLLEPKVFMPGAKVPLLLPNVGSTLYSFNCIAVHSIPPTLSFAVSWLSTIVQFVLRAAVRWTRT